MKLSADETSWIGDYRQALDAQFPGLVDEIILFGSKARGTATEDSDLDILVVIREGDWKIKRAVADPGYELSACTDVVPSIIVLTIAEWAWRRDNEAPFWRTVTRDGVNVG